MRKRQTTLVECWQVSRLNGSQKSKISKIRNLRRHDEVVLRTFMRKSVRLFLSFGAVNAPSCCCERERREKPQAAFRATAAAALGEACCGRYILQHAQLATRKAPIKEQAVDDALHTIGQSFSFGTSLLDDDDASFESNFQFQNALKRARIVCASHMDLLAPPRSCWTRFRR